MPTTGEPVLVFFLVVATFGVTDDQNTPRLARPACPKQMSISALFRRFNGQLGKWQVGRKWRGFALFRLIQRACQWFGIGAKQRNSKETGEPNDATRRHLPV